MANLQFPHPKDPDSDLDYICDWSDWLGNDTITDSSWVIPEGLTESGDDYNSTVTTIWLKGGVSGESYTLTNKITTSGLRTVERNIILRVKER